MIYRLMLVAAVCLAMGSAAMAQDRYKINPASDRVNVDVKAERSGNSITVATQITVDRAHQDKTTLTAPRVTMQEGQRAVVRVGTPADKEEITTGFRVDFISIKGENEVLAVSQALDNGAVVWAESKTVRVKKAK